MDAIGDDEIILRHIPGGEPWQAAGPRIISANFQLRTDRAETGVSVTRAAITSAEELLRSIRTSPGSAVASARVGNIRAIGLDVVPDPLPHDAGHVEIRSQHASLETRTVRQRLAKLFQFVERE